MALPKTEFLTNDGLTRKRWAKELFKILLPSVEFNELIGTGEDSQVQMRTELGKGEGDTITFGIVLPLKGEGIVGNDTVEGNEEKLVFRNYNMTIEELNHAVDTGGRMEEQRIPYNLLEIGKNGLRDWWASKLSDFMFAHLCGDTTFKIAGKTFGQDPTASDAYHVLRVNDVATDALITSAEVLDLTFLDRMKQLAEMPTGPECYKLRPLKLKGKNYYRVILHTYVFDQLRNNMNVGQWGDLSRQAQKLQDPIAEFEYNGMLVSKSERIRKCPTNSSAYLNILLGAQAACLAWGGAGESKSTTMSFVPYTKDAERFMQVRGGGILGIKKTKFQNVDFGVITGVSYGVPLT
jgi:N4-gp56 family major capsid protein